MDKGLFFLLISVVCFYLVLDEVYGQKPISKFTTAIIPSSAEHPSSTHDTEEGKTHGGSGKGF